MGPTNVALAKLYQVDQQLREARGRLDEATKNVRIQERRVNDLGSQLAIAQTRLKEQQAKGGALELDLKSRDAHIEKLRTQQQNSKNNKEYQAFLLEINTEKVERNKIEEQTLVVMEAIEKGQAEVKDLAGQLEAEQAKLAGMKGEIGDKISHLQAEIDAIQPQRDQAAAAVPAKALEMFERLADRLEGEAMAAIAKPDRRREEYLCSACNMSLVADMYNRLHVRDELVFCPSCRRVLYIPDDLPPELAIHAKKAAGPAKG